MDLDGPRWREKLPPVPSVPASAQLRAWRPAAEMPQAQVGGSCRPHQPGIPGGGGLHSFLLSIIILSHVFCDGKAVEQEHEFRCETWD